MVYVYAVVLTLVNLLCWVGILFGLPGTWLMILFPVLLKWWQPDQFMVSWTVLGVAVGLAVLGEVLELRAGCGGVAAHGGHHTGCSPGTRRQYRRRDHGYSAAGAARGALAGRMPRGLCRCPTREPVGRAHAVPELRDGPGGGHWAVLGHGGQAGYRRDHRGHADDCRLRVRGVAPVLASMLSRTSL